jgi:uncharacterized protein YfaT (DUF1175 family)
MRQPRHNHLLIYYDGFFYAIAGSYEKVPGQLDATSVEKYKFPLKKWKEQTAMPEPMIMPHFSAVVAQHSNTQHV